MTDMELLGLIWFMATIFCIIWFHACRDIPGKEADEVVFMLSLASFIPLVPLMVMLISFFYFWDTRILGNKYDRQTTLKEVQK